MMVVETIALFTLVRCPWDISADAAKEIPLLPIEIHRDFNHRIGYWASSSSRPPSPHAIHSYLRGELTESRPMRDRVPECPQARGRSAFDHAASHALSLHPIEAGYGRLVSGPGKWQRHLLCTRASPWAPGHGKKRADAACLLPNSLHTYNIRPTGSATSNPSGQGGQLKTVWHEALLYQ